ncbi:hypothetical protein AYI70_g8139 [Smittium culicis]|uniref:Transcription factor domain-containing protein n=1 Tax=Smittium culicis TaxID=133412 RepID=A0A1R1XHA9_9FUNG|nr:hypothetical protein AYI70_g8139 [Smittium culicis]
MDAKCKHLYSEPSIYLEFKRRIFWSYYIIECIVYVFDSGVHTMLDRDIVVNLPKNDFKYKYCGNFYQCDHELVGLYYIANSKNNSNLPKDNFSFIIKMYLLTVKITQFLNKRGLNKFNAQITINKKFLSLVGHLNDFKSKIAKKYNSSALYESIPHYRTADGFELVNKVELSIFTYFVLQLFNTMCIILYQSELVRHRSFIISPERIKLAKNKCLEAALKFDYYFTWKYEQISKKRQTFISAPWKFFCNIIFINLNFTEKDPLVLKDTSRYHKLCEYMLSVSEKNQSMKYIYFITQKLYSVKKNAYLKNLSKKIYLSQMNDYSISKYDLDPWLVPRCSSFVKFGCCFDVNLSTLDVQEYITLRSFENDKSNHSAQ